MNLEIANTGIKQDDQGRYCLNDLHRASGNEAKHKPSEWLRNKQTVELIDELSKAGFPAIESKQGLGTFVAKQLVYAYAMWISPAFHLKVINTFDAVATNTIPMKPAQMSRMQLLQLAMQAEQERLQLEHTVDELKPRAAVADRLAGADGLLSIRDAAKSLKMKERAFITWLIENKWLYRDMKGRLRGYSDKTPKYVDHKVTPIPTVDDADKVSLQAMIAPAGLTRLADIFNVEAELMEAA